ncbi:MAG: DUF3800 domain-containing protein [Firmicutes bacterium]|nr:DUF3800 domain-containing protein [Bacillota bacterium]
MDIFVYSDESGVFDKEHNALFVFGGLLFLSNDERCECSRMYAAAEKVIREREQSGNRELKASFVSNSSKGKLYRSLNRYRKFGVIVRQQYVLDRIFKSKKDKQRYLDYVFKIGLKRKLQEMIRSGEIDPDQVRNIYVLVDEHSTATNGCYELREALEAELKGGTYNYDYSTAFPPVFPRMNEVCLFFKDSSTTLLVRAADIVANRIYHKAQEGIAAGKHDNNLFVVWLP